MSVQCPDRECFLQTKLAANCLLYHPSPNCSIPCKLELCPHILVNNVVCHIWHCNSKTTTKSTTTPGPFTTTVAPESDVGVIFSYLFNAILSTLGMIILIIFLKKFLKKRAQRRIEELELEERNRHPIVRFSIANENAEIDDFSDSDFSDFVNEPAPSTSENRTKSLASSVDLSSPPTERTLIFKKDVTDFKSADVSFGAIPKRYPKKFVTLPEFQERFHKFMKENFDFDATPLTREAAEFLDPNLSPEDLNYFEEKYLNYQRKNSL